MLGTVEIEYLPTPQAGYAACRLMPEFKINARSPYAQRLTIPESSHVPAPIGPAIPAGLLKPERPKRERRHLDEAQQSHHDLKPYAKRFPHPVQKHDRAPFGTAPVYDGTLAGLKALVEKDRREELAWFVKTQHLEIATAREEIGALSLSSSFDDDDDDGVKLEIAERYERVGYTEATGNTVDPQVNHDARRYGSAYDTPEQSLLDRVDWEQYILACGPVFKFFLARKPDGKSEVRCNDARVMKRPEHLAKFIKPLLALMRGRSMDELEHDRHIAEFKNKPVWTTMTPAQQLRWMQRTPDVERYLHVRNEDTEPNMTRWMADAQKDVDPLAIELIEDEDEPGVLITAAALPPEEDGGATEFGVHTFELDAHQNTESRVPRMATPRGKVEFAPNADALETLLEQGPSLQAWT